VDREKLAKLLALTTSDNDHEALSAMRAANRMLREVGKIWEDVLEGPERVLSISISRPHAVPEEFYQAMEEWRRRPKR
jgi:hypothetical protein